MKILNKTGIYCLGSLLCLTVAGVSNAATLVDGQTNETNFLDGNFSSGQTITKIGEVEGIAGGLTKELFFGVNGSSTQTPQSSTDFIWTDGTEFNWVLDWNPTTNTATFNVNNGSSIIDYTFLPTELDQLNAFGLIAKTDGSNSSLVEAGTTINLSVDDVSFTGNNGVGNGGTVNLATLGFNDSVSSSAVSGTQVFDKQFFVLSETDRANEVEISQITGSFSLDWDTVNPQDTNANSRVSFELKLFDPPANAAQSTPEPASIFGLLALGTLGFSRRQSRNK